MLCCGAPYLLVLVINSWVVGVWTRPDLLPSQGGHHEDHGDHGHGEHGHGEHGHGEHGHGEHGHGEHGHGEHDHGDDHGELNGGFTPWWKLADSPFNVAQRPIETTEFGSSTVEIPEPGNIAFGAGIRVIRRPQGLSGHYNPFLPRYRPQSTSEHGVQGTQRPRQPSGSQGGQRPVQQQQHRPPVVANPFLHTDLNRNPGSGNSGPVSAQVPVCASALACVPESECDPYSGFLKGALKGPPANPAQPTVAYQRCGQLYTGQHGNGVCCRYIGNPPQASFTGHQGTATSSSNFGTGGHQQSFNPPSTGQTNVFIPSQQSFNPSATSQTNAFRPSTAGSSPQTNGDQYVNNPFFTGLVGPSAAGGKTGEQLRPGSSRQPIACNFGQACVEAKLCGDDGYVITDGAGLLDIRAPSTEFCLTEVSTRGVCCDSRSQPTQSPTPQREIFCGSSEQCVEVNYCDDQGFIISDGSGLIDIRNRFNANFCRTPSSARGACCKRRPDPTQSVPVTTPPPSTDLVEATCDTADVCVEPSYCGDDGFVITDGAGIIDIRNRNFGYFCRVPGGGKGSCCSPQPDTSGHRELISCPEGHYCIHQNLCSSSGIVVGQEVAITSNAATSSSNCLQPDNNEGVCCPLKNPETDGGGSATGGGSSESGSGGSGTGDGSTSGQQTSTETQCFMGEQCVENQLCDDQGYIITDGSGLINIRFNNRFYCRTPSGAKGKCCKPRPSSSTEDVVQCDADESCVAPDSCDADGFIITDGAGQLDIRFNNRNRRKCIRRGPHGSCCRHRPQQEEDFDCGQSVNIRIQGVSPDSTEANFGEIPWQTVIFYNNYTYVCGGSLVSRRHVVTGAHCVSRLRAIDIKVRLGDYQLNTEDEPFPHQDIKVRSIITHPSFRPNNLHNDVSVLVLEEPAKLEPHVWPVCLPKPGQKFTGRCTVSGWGRKSFEGNFSPLLKKVTVPMVENQQCQSQLRPTRLGSAFRLDESFVCAGGEQGVDACRGDGGGPLSCAVDGVYMLAGVTAWGIGCGRQDVPGVYANTEHLLPFIQQVIRDDAINQHGR